MARRTKEEAEKTRARILANALTMFTKKGYEHATLNDIAAKMRMTKGAVYWHFESKHAILMALIGEMFKTFQKMIMDLLPPGETSFEGLSFSAVAKMMIRHAMQVVEDSRMSAYFLLVHEQIPWSSSSMAQVRDDLLKNPRFGPWEAFHVAVDNDIRSGRVKPDVDSIQIAYSCIALWNGLVHSRIAGFLQCDLEDTLRNAYTGIWNSIKSNDNPQCKI
ncbi:MAG: TetR family transcriptional regulator [Kiritimatiellae bacterium]|nr:TetR family transcriptional regulator [Kiritimatiellia bacterium]